MRLQQGVNRVKPYASPVEKAGYLCPLQSRAAKGGNGRPLSEFGLAAAAGWLPENMSKVPSHLLLASEENSSGTSGLMCLTSWISPS